MSLIKVLIKLRARTWMERGLLLEAFVWLGMMRMAVLLVSFQRIANYMRLTRKEATPAFPAPLQTRVASGIGWAVQAAAARTPWESACLTQALVGMVMLQRRGIPGILYLGVAKNLDTTINMAAHAWLKCGGDIITGGSGHERFSVISTFVGNCCR